jgi:hypothetical protein
MRLWGYEVIWLYGYEVMRLWGYEVIWLYGYEVIQINKSTNQRLNDSTNLMVSTASLTS